MFRHSRESYLHTEDLYDYHDASNNIHDISVQVQPSKHTFYSICKLSSLSRLTPRKGINWILLNARFITHHFLHPYIYPCTILTAWMPINGRRSRGKTRSGHHHQLSLLKMTTNHGQGLPDQMVTAISPARHLQIACQVPRHNQSSSSDRILRKHQKGSLTTLICVSFGKMTGRSPSNSERRIGKSVWFDRLKCHAVQRSQSSRQEYMSPQTTLIRFNTLLLNMRKTVVSKLLHGTLT